MKTRYKILIIIIIAFFAAIVILKLPIYPQERQCDIGFEDRWLGYCIPRLTCVFCESEPIKINVTRMPGHVELSDQWNPKWGSIPPNSETEIKEIIVNRDYIDLLSNSVDYLRETKNIHIVTIGTDHEKEKTIRVGIDKTVLTDYTIKDIEREIREIVGNDIGITIEYAEPIYFR